LGEFERFDRFMRLRYEMLKLATPKEFWEASDKFLEKCEQLQCTMVEVENVLNLFSQMNRDKIKEKLSESEISGKQIVSYTTKEQIEDEQIPQPES